MLNWLLMEIDGWLHVHAQDQHEHWAWLCDWYDRRLIEKG